MAFRVTVSFLVEFCYQTVYCWNFDSETKIHINHFSHLACFNGNESFLKRMMHCVSKGVRKHLLA